MQRQRTHKGPIDVGVGMRSPILWFGGKGNLVSKLLQFIPAHDAYIEPFFGGGSLFFAKRPAKIEVINDIDKDLMNFYAVLRDEEKFARFHRLAYLTPYSRCICWDVGCFATGRSYKAGIIGEGITERKEQRRTECIWMNYYEQKGLTRFLEGY